MRPTDPHIILAEALARFAQCVDEGNALQMLDYCADQMAVRMGPQTGGRETMEHFLAARQSAVHQTRHIVGWPTVDAADSEKVRGSVPVTAFRMVEGDFSIGIASFRIGLERADNKWLINEWELEPFLLRNIHSDSLL